MTSFPANHQPRSRFRLGIPSGRSDAARSSGWNRAHNLGRDWSVTSFPANHQVDRGSTCALRVRVAAMGRAPDPVATGETPKKKNLLLCPLLLSLQGKIRHEITRHQLTNERRSGRMLTHQLWLRTVAFCGSDVGRIKDLVALFFSSRFLVVFLLLFFSSFSFSFQCATFWFVAVVCSFPFGLARLSPKSSTRRRLWPSYFRRSRRVRDVRGPALCCCCSCCCCCCCCCCSFLSASI